MIKKIYDTLHIPYWLFYALIVVVILRIPSFFEPYSYGDEMIYLTLGEGVRKGLTLYSQVHDNKPPLLYLIAALAGNLFWFKAILAIWNLMTIFVFWKFAESLFPRNLRLQKVSTITFAALTTFPLLEGNIVNAELFMIGPIILAFHLLLSAKRNAKTVFVAGLLFAIAVLFKVPSIFDIPAIFFLWIVTLKFKREEIRKLITETIILLAGVALPIFITFLWYYYKGAFQEYLIAAFLQNVGYLSSFRPGDIQEPFLVRNAPLLIRGVVVGFCLAILFVAKMRLTKQFIFISAWLLLSLFAVTLSERPYSHYLIQSVPPLSLLVGMLFSQKAKGHVLALIPITIALFVPVYFRFWYYPTLPYYVRFTKLSVGAMSKQEYLESFGSHIPRNYRVAQHLISTTDYHDKVFVWGDSSMIYALSRRLPPIKYVADYHIKDFSSNREIVAQLEKDPPAVVVILSNSNPPSELTSFLGQMYLPSQTIDGTEIWRLLPSKSYSQPAY